MFSVRLFPQNKLSSFQYNFIITRQFTATVVKKHKIESVNLAYSSYETTVSYSNDAPPPLIVMHGLFGSKANWNTLCKVFNQRTRPQRKVIAVDARNHGDSPHSKDHSYPHLAEDLKALFTELKIKKAALLGHSMGGRAMMYFALIYPELVDKLLIADISPITTSPNFKTTPAVFEALNKIVLPQNVTMSSARLSADLQLAKKINDRGIRSFLLTNLIQKSDGSYTWRLNISALISNFQNHIAAFPTVKNVKFVGPILFIGGGASDFIQKTDHSKILKLFPKAEFQYIEGAGHWVHSERPNEFLHTSLEFLNRVITES